MASKLILEGNESLEEIRDIMKELKLAEGRLISRNGLDSELSNFNEPDELLNETELLDLEKFSFPPDLDASVLAVPNLESKKTEYPADFMDTLELDSDLLSVKHNLVNYVKAVINEESLSKFFFKNDSPGTNSSPEDSDRTHPHVPPRRKDSYTIHRSNKPQDATFFPSPEMLRQPYPSMSTPSQSQRLEKCLDNSYSTNTYSKKSSPFAPFVSRQHLNNPFMVNGSALSDRAQELNGVSKNDNANVPQAYGNRTLTRPSRSAALQAKIGMENTMSELQSSTLKDSPVENHGKLINLSMEEIQDMARLQQESLLSSGLLDGNLRKSSQDWTDPLNKSMDEDDASGSTGNGAWSNDTYSVSVSNPPSEASSGISSPPAGSLEDVQVEPLRRSMPNLVPRNLSLAPAYSGSLQREAYYNSDLRLSQNRSRTRTIRLHNVSTEKRNADEAEQSIRYDSSHMEPLKRALARADTYLQREGMTTTEPGNINRYATYQLPKHSAPKPLNKGSRLPTPRSSFGYGCGNPSNGSGHFESPNDSDGRETVTPTGGHRLSYNSGSAVHKGQGQIRYQRSAGHR